MILAGWLIAKIRGIKRMTYIALHECVSLLPPRGFYYCIRLAMLYAMYSLTFILS